MRDRHEDDPDGVLAEANDQMSDDLTVPGRPQPVTGRVLSLVRSGGGEVG